MALEGYSEKNWIEFQQFKLLDAIYKSMEEYRNHPLLPIEQNVQVSDTTGMP